MAQKVLIIGGFGMANIGDEAMLEAILRNLRKRRPDVAYVLSSPFPDDTAHYHQARCIREPTYLGWTSQSRLPSRVRGAVALLLFYIGAWLTKFGLPRPLWSSAHDWLDELKSADVLLNAGCGILNSVIPQELYKKCVMYLAAQILGVPVVVSGQTIGPLVGGFDRWIARIGMNSIDTVTFRDLEASRSLMREVGICRPTMCDTADDALSLPPLDTITAREILHRDLPASWRDVPAELVVVMNMKGSLSLFRAIGNLGESAAELAQLARIADQMITAHRAKVFFLGTDFSKGVDDRDCHRKIVALMKNRHAVACMEGTYSASALMGIIGCADFAIGCRYHFCVFSAAQAVPFLGIASGDYQRRKLRGIADLAGIPEAYLDHDLGAVDDAVVTDRLQQLLARRAALQQHLAKVVPKLQRQSLIGVERTCTLLKKHADAASGQELN